MPHRLFSSSNYLPAAKTLEPNLRRVVIYQCKFIMGITELKLEEYIKKQEHTGRPLKERDLMGWWACQTNDDYYKGRVPER